MNKTNLDYVLDRFLVELNRISPLSREDFAQISQKVDFKKIEKNHFCNNQGGDKDCMLFICAGLIRSFYTTHNGRELNKAFIGENQITFTKCNTASNSNKFSLSALEDSVVLSVSMSKILELCKTNINWANLWICITENSKCQSEMREIQLLLDSAEKRYLDFINQNQHLVARVPNYHVASYVGISQEALCRIKRRLRNNSTTFQASEIECPVVNGQFTNEVALSA